MGKCAAILASLLERPDATWFKSPVPADTPGYQAAILYPMDYSKIERNLQGGRYQTAAGFASDMRLVFKNAVTFSPPRGNECNMAARECQCHGTPTRTSAHAAPLRAPPHTSSRTAPCFSPIAHQRDEGC